MARLLLAAVLAAEVGLGLLAVPAGVGAAPQGPLGPLSLDKPLNLTADEVTVDNTGTGLVARGHVVVTYGPDRATADLLRLNRAARTAELTGHARITDPKARASGNTVFLYLTAGNQVTRVVTTGSASFESPEYSLAADRIDADRTTDRLAADGHVNAFAAPDMIVTGERATYDQRRKYGVVTGHPSASNKAGRLRGNWFELFRGANLAVVHGPVEAEVYGATITGAGATIDFTKSAAVFTGRVVVERRQGTLWADRVTIYYDTRRIMAEGETHAKFNDLGEDTTP